MGIRRRPSAVCQILWGYKVLLLSIVTLGREPMVHGDGYSLTLSAEWECKCSLWILATRARMTPVFKWNGIQKRPGPAGAEAQFRSWFSASHENFFMSIVKIQNFTGFG